MYVYLRLIFDTNLFSIYIGNFCIRLLGKVDGCRASFAQVDNFDHNFITFITRLWCLVCGPTARDQVWSLTCCLVVPQFIYLSLLQSSLSSGCLFPMHFEAVQKKKQTHKTNEFSKGTDEVIMSYFLDFHQ